MTDLVSSVSQVETVDQARNWYVRRDECTSLHKEFEDLQLGFPTDADSGLVAPKLPRGKLSSSWWLCGCEASAASEGSMGEPCLEGNTARKICTLQ